MMSGDVWFADSAPGNAQPATLLKCGGRKPSLGLSVPSPFVISAPTADALADRALVVPGTHPTLSPDHKTRAQQLGYSFDGNGLFPYFDGNTILHDLPMPGSDSGSFSFSGWIFPDNMAQGSIIRSPVTTLALNTACFLSIGAPGVGAAFAGGITPDAGNSQYPAQRSVVAMFGMTTAANPAREQHYYLYNSDVGGAHSSAFFHLMIGIQASAGVAQITVYINDTAVCSNLALETNSSNGSPSNYTIPYAALHDGAKPAPYKGINGLFPNSTGANRWELGAGAYRDNATGATEAVDSAIQCTVAEWWLAPSHFVDWTSGTNRNKFHTTDAVGNYVPVNLGTRGQALGFTPAIYCTGNPGAFRINRATGKLLSMVGGGTDVTFIPRYGEVPNMVSDDRVPGG